MRAAFYTEYGGPEILRTGELPDPKVGPSEVLVRVRSASVNPVDWKLATGALDPLMEAVFPVVPGWDVAGVVERAGLDTPEFAAGDEIYAYARKDFVHGGSYAELISVPVRAVARKPPTLSWDEAAAVPLAGLTALQLLTRLGTGPGSTVLVHGAAGGVGVFAVQIAAALGARVIGTASPRNHEFLAGLGAEPVGYGDGLPERVRALAADGVGIVLDLVGGVLADTQAVLAPGGRHASIADGSVAAAGGLYGWVRPDGPGLAELARLAGEGRLQVPVAATFDLEKAADAWRASQEGHTRGKIVIRVSDGG